MARSEQVPVDLATVSTENLVVDREGLEMAEMLFAKTAEADTHSEAGACDATKVATQLQVASDKPAPLPSSVTDIAPVPAAFDTKSTPETVGTFSENTDPTATTVPRRFPTVSDPLLRGSPNVADDADFTKTDESEYHRVAGAADESNRAARDSPEWECPICALAVCRIVTDVLPLRG